MLKKINPSTSTNTEFLVKNSGLTGSSDILEKFKKVLGDFQKAQISDPIKPFRKDHLDCYERIVNYGILELLEGTWLSYVSKNDSETNKSLLKINHDNKGQQAFNSRPYLLTSGIHTTIMPSPGTNSETIPGKYSFECDQYVEKLTFTKVEGGVRNRGGSNEQFCGAYKYDQVIKKVNLRSSEGEAYDYFPSEEPIKTKNKQNDSKIELDVIENLEVKGIHEENGMYLWLSDMYNHAASNDSIRTNRGMNPILRKIKISIYEDDPNSKVDVKILNPYYIVFSGKICSEGTIETLIYPDKTFAYIGRIEERLVDGGLYNVNDLFPTSRVISSSDINLKDFEALEKHFISVIGREVDKYVPIDELTDEHKKNQYFIIPGKELSKDDGQKGPHYLPDYTLSRSGVIPHGSTITLLGNLKSFKGKLYSEDAPTFIEDENIWDYKHLAISPTMGRAGAPRKFIKDSDKADFDIDKGMPAWRLKTLEDLVKEDEGGNKIYSKEIVSHPLFPYSVRPDLRLRDANKGEKIVHTAHIVMSSRNETGAQGGVLNIPFVDKYVPAIEMKMNMWLQIVEKDTAKYVLQLQYEQVVNFEFHFGDDGGKTSWPHIQVNTLRREDEMSEEEKKYFQSIFSFNELKRKEEPATSTCPFHK
ncbi:peroxidase, FMP-type [Sphingobacterium sp. MYb382]|uniref:peroxidase, FMP-type n=1 Tax=Sphingobacterium sp. MYb382 TaxID=2745278 RepID=UPI0030B0319B